MASAVKLSPHYFELLPVGPNLDCVLSVVFTIHAQTKNDCLVSIDLNIWKVTAFSLAIWVANDHSLGSTVNGKLSVLNEIT